MSYPINTTTATMANKDTLRKAALDIAAALEGLRSAGAIKNNVHDGILLLLDIETLTKGDEKLVTDLIDFSEVSTTSAATSETLAAASSAPMSPALASSSAAPAPPTATVTSTTIGQHTIRPSAVAIAPVQHPTHPGRNDAKGHQSTTKTVVNAAGTGNQPQRNNQRTQSRRVATAPIYNLQWHISRNKTNAALAEYNARHQNGGNAEATAAQMKRTKQQDVSWSAWANFGSQAKIGGALNLTPSLVK